LLQITICSIIIVRQEEYFVKRHILKIVRQKWYSVRRHILKAANSALRPFNARIAAIATTDIFDMSSAVQRILEHDMLIKSIIDIGASSGRWSIDAMRTFPRASFVAIEPLYERQGVLERLKQEHDNFDYVLCVAGDRDGGQAMLNVSDDLDGSTVDGSGGESINVPIRTIDAIVCEKNLEGPFLLKFDTHGYEIPILKGAIDTLTKTNIVVMEVYNFNITNNNLRFHEMCSHMERLGFRCYDIANPMLRPYDKAFFQMDILFCRNSSKMFSHTGYK
jgi:FkbM family methyltransferase